MVLYSVRFRKVVKGLILRFENIEENGVVSIEGRVGSWEIGLL